MWKPYLAHGSQKSRLAGSVWPWSCSLLSLDLINSHTLGLNGYDRWKEHLSQGDSHVRESTESILSVQVPGYLPSAKCHAGHWRYARYEDVKKKKKTWSLNCCSWRVSRELPSRYHVRFLPAALWDLGVALLIRQLGRWILPVWRMESMTKVRGPRQGNNWMAVKLKPQTPDGINICSRANVPVITQNFTFSGHPGSFMQSVWKFCCSISPAGKGCGTQSALAYLVSKQLSDSISTNKKGYNYTLIL